MSEMRSNVRYCFYATLLDTFQNYLDSSEMYQKFYGSSDDPSCTEEEYEERCKQDLLNRINRVPFESEAADKGTAFNEVVDCLILGKNQTDRKDMEIDFTGSEDIISVRFKNREFYFPRAVCMEFADYYKGAVPQVYCDSVIHTKYGDVYLYGYIDELMPYGIHDIKTTSKYENGKFRKHWQHRLYPYCLTQKGNYIEYFEYNVAEMTKYGKITTYTEFYKFEPEKAEAELVSICEWLIEFVEANKDKITDRKIFNLV